MASMQFSAPPKTAGRGRGRGKPSRPKGSGGSGRGAHGSPLVATFNKKHKTRGRGRGHGATHDRDNDINMDYQKPATSGANFDFGDEFRVIVSGFPPGTSEQALASFLQNRAPVPFSVSRVEKSSNNDRLILVVPSRQDAMTLHKLNNENFNGSTLHVKYGKSKGKPPTAPAGGPPNNQLLSSFLDARYNASLKFLNLDGVQGIPQEGGNLRIDFQNIGFVRAMLTILSEKFPDLTTINFANNRIHSLRAFETLHQYLPYATNFCFSNNELLDFSELDYLTSIKNLRELILHGNPMVDSVDEATYHSEVGRRFPSLKYLDQKRLAPVIKLPEVPQLAATVLPTTHPTFFDHEQRRDIAATFLRRYIDIYDAQAAAPRAGLLEVYTDYSLFSLTVSEKLTDSTGGPGPKKGAAKETPLSAYLSMSRNLMRVGDLNRRVDLVQVGRVNIIHALSRLPPSTHHSLDTMNIDVFLMPPVVGAATAPNLMIITLHGSFWETTIGCNRSFDRTFVLAPPPPGSRAAQEGWPAVIINDMLNIRNYVGSRTGTPVSGAVAPAAMTPTPMAPIAVAAAPTVAPIAPAGALSPGGPAFPGMLGMPHTPDLQNELVAKVAYVTGLRPEFARQLLQGQGWDYAKAMQVFATMKSSGAIQPQYYAVPQ